MVTVVADDRKPREMAVPPARSVPVVGGHRESGARWASTVMVTVQVGDEGRSVAVLPRQ